MYAFLPSTPLLSGGNTTFHTCNTPIIRQPVHRHRRRERANVSMWTMDDLPESLRIPERPRIGFSDYSEKLNGRLAMIGFVAALVIEVFTGEGIVPMFTALLGN